MTATRLPLTLAQRRLWLERLIEPSRADDRLSATFALDASVDRARLALAIDAVVRRHDALRVTLDAREPLQSFAEPRLTWSVSDAGLALSVPHECCDARSLRIVGAEVFAACAGSDLPPAASYADAVAAEQQLAGDETSLPKWRPPTRMAPELSGVDHDAVAVESRAIDIDVNDAARVAAFETLVRRLSGEQELATGIWSMPREVQAVGCFTTVVPLTTIENAPLHAAVPFDRMLALLRPERHAGRHPLFEITFSLHDLAVPSRARFDLELTAGASIQLVYRSALWPAAFARNVIDHYVRLLAGNELPAHPLTTASDELRAVVRGNDALRLTPSGARARIARTLAPVPQHDRWLIFTGEPLTADLVQRWRRTFPGETRILNVYSDACAYEIPAKPAAGMQPIGQPFAGVDVQLVSDDGRHCATGEVGELRLNGTLTGDRARVRSDGLLELLGRSDRMVSIGETLVQLDAVEADIRALPGVTDAIVTAEHGPDGERRLVARVTAAAEATLDASMIAATVGQRRMTVLIAGPAFVAARDPIELQLARMWEELLEVPAVSIDDDFFALGGDSMLALQLCARIATELGLSLDPTVLLPDATISRLAHLIRHRRAASDTPLVTIQRGASAKPLFCVHPSGGSILCYVDLARLMGPDWPLFGLKGADPRSSELPPHDAVSMAARYVEAIRAAQPAGPYALAGYSFGGVIAFEMARQLSDEVSLLALLDTRFRRAYGPGDRNAVVDLGEILERHDLDRDAADEQSQHELWRELTELGMRYLPAEGRRRRGLSAIQEFCRAYRLMPAADDLGYLDLRRFLRTLRSNFRTMRDYRPEPIGTRTVLFTATSTVDGRESDHAKNAALWRTVAANLEVRTVDANHFNLLAPPAVDVLARALTELLNDA